MQGFYLRILETFALIMLKVEFGAKVSFSHQKEGYVSLDRLNCVLAGLRVSLITIKSLLYPTHCWPEIQERCQRDPDSAFRAIIKMHAK